MNQSLLESCRVLPVITAHDVDTTVQLARALIQGNVRAVEITLRTDAALDCIRAVKAEVPELVVAAGTITNPDAMSAALMAGADFCVSPGLTERLLRAASEADVDFVPGVATASEILLGMEYGFQCFKLFPAVGLGGINFLNYLAGPFPGVRFCPTGGLTQHNFKEFLDLPNVVCCGGSWMVANSLVSSGNWGEIARLTGEAMAGAK